MRNELFAGLVLLALVVAYAEIPTGFWRRVVCLLTRRRKARRAKRGILWPVRRSYIQMREDRERLKNLLERSRNEIQTECYRGW